MKRGTAVALIIMPKLLYQPFYHRLMRRTALFTAILAAAGVISAANPILPDFHADPEILYSNGDGKYYIYSTTDGIPSWCGYYYHAFSSPDRMCFNPDRTIKPVVPMK